MVAPSKPAYGAADDKLSDCALCPFFWVDTTVDAKIANMKEIWHTFGSIRLPIMNNTKCLKPHDELFKLKGAKEVAAPLSNVMLITSDSATPKASGKPAKGSAKKKH